MGRLAVVVHSIFVTLAIACGRIGFDAAGAVDATDGVDGIVTSRHWVLTAEGPRVIAPRLAYHPVRRTVLMYGGDESNQPPLSPVAGMLELTATGWQIVCSPCPPGARTAPAFGYDSARDRLVVYGGWNAAGTELADHWEWDGIMWQQVSTSGAPGPRVGAQLVFDGSRSRLVMIGGLSNNTLKNDVYELVAGAWVPRLVTGGPSSVSFGCVTTYDPIASRILVYADAATQPDLDELWSLDGEGWTRLCADCTGRRRSYASMIYDLAGGGLYLTGGWDSVGSEDLAGTWRWTSGWTMSANLPPRRDTSCIAYDRARDVIVLFGGNGTSCGGNCGETWELVPD